MVIWGFFFFFNRHGLAIMIFIINVSRNIYLLDQELYPVLKVVNKINWIFSVIFRKNQVFDWKACFEDGLGEAIYSGWGRQTAGREFSRTNQVNFNATL